ncbi:hypothetical protein C0989_004178 [Termitomyces sp. Mn162]|nr:hypothetical protein C0989_004178 [Termitomyces sp. Mn162]
MHHSRNSLHLWRFWWRDARLGELPPTTLPQSHCPKSNDITTYTFPCPTTFLPVPYHIDTTLPSLLTHIVPSVRLPRSVGIVAPSVPSQGMDFDFCCSGQPTQTKEAIIQSDGLLLLLRRRMAHTGAEGRLELLPNVLSYSPLSIPILTTDHSSPPVAKDVTLFRRDLFDAPFQLIAQENITEDTSEAPSTSTGVNALAFVEAPFDIVPGIYEGGVKTWECSIDLAGVPGGPPPQTRCTRKTYHRAIPTLFLLRQVFSCPPEEAIDTRTIMPQFWSLFPSPPTYVVSATDTSPAAAFFRTSHPPPQAGEDTESTNPNAPGDLFLTPEVKSAFLTSLEVYKI